MCWEVFQVGEDGQAWNHSVPQQLHFNCCVSRLKIRFIFALQPCKLSVLSFELCFELCDPPSSSSLRMGWERYPAVWGFLGYNCVGWDWKTSLEILCFPLILVLICPFVVCVKSGFCWFWAWLDIFPQLGFSGKAFLFFKPLFYTLFNLGRWKFSLLCSSRAILLNSFAPWWNWVPKGYFKEWHNNFCSSGTTARHCLVHSYPGRFYKNFWALKILAVFLSGDLIFFPQHKF